jgi:hypothetical protein
LQGHGKISFVQFLTSGHPTVPVRINWSVFAREMPSRSVWASMWFMLYSLRWYEPFGESLFRLKINTLKRFLNLHF